MKYSFFIFLLLVLFEMSGGLIREYFYIPIQNTWTDAQTYCRQNYKDLATVTTEEENKNLVKTLNDKDIYGWIGMNKKTPSPQIWQWSGGEPVTYFNWYTDQPTLYSTIENCVNAGPLGWNDQDCSASSTFYCYRSWNLVTEKKTWQEALEYCKTNHTNLASPATDAQLLLAETVASEAGTVTAEAQSVSVWTGLQFLDGQWFWISGETLGTSDTLPSCPAYDHRCGARNLNTKKWENHDCNEKLNFICY